MQTNQSGNQTSFDTNQQPSPRRGTMVAIVLLWLAVFIVFGRVSSYGLLSWDDGVNFTANPYLRQFSAESLVAIWRQQYAGLYAPLTYTVWWAEAAVSRTWLPADAARPFDPRVFHVGGLVLHALSATLVFVLLQRLVGRTSAACAGALLFALHPLQAESASWATETKGLLAGVLGWGALVALLDDSGRRAVARNIAAWLLFVGALLAKPSAVSIPLIGVAIVIAWPRWAQRRVIATLAGWLVLALLFTRLTMSVQTDVAMLPTSADAALWKVAGERSMIAADALTFYTRKLFWPWPLSVDYGRRPADVLATAVPSAAWLLPGVLLLAAVASRQRRLWLAACAIFVAGLLPTLGLVPFSFQKFSTVADRFAYLALFGPAVAVAVALDPWPTRFAKGLALVALFACAGISFVQAGFWRSDTTLFLHAAEYNSKSFLSQNALGNEAMRASDLPTAETHFRQAKQSDPTSAAACLNLGMVMGSLGRPAEAIVELRRALELRPGYTKAQRALGSALVANGQSHEARTVLEPLVAQMPDDPITRFDLAIALAGDGELRRSVDHLSRVVELDAPTMLQASAANMLAWTRATAADANLRRPAEAVRLAEKACSVAPDNPRYFDTLAATYAAAERWDEAVETGNRAVELGAKSLPPAVLDAMRQRVEGYRKQQPYTQNTVAAPVNKAVAP